MEKTEISELKISSRTVDVCLHGYYSISSQASQFVDLCALPLDLANSPKVPDRDDRVRIQNSAASSPSVRALFLPPTKLEHRHFQKTPSAAWVRLRSL